MFYENAVPVKKKNKIPMFHDNAAQVRNEHGLRKYLGPINIRTGNYRAKYLFYRYDDVVAMILLVTGFRLECAKINRVESDNYLQ